MQKDITKRVSLLPSHEQHTSKKLHKRGSDKTEKEASGKTGFTLIGPKSHDGNANPRRERHMKAAFTLIELIVVMAVLAILVLLAAPKFLNYTEKARASQAVNDIKTLETKLDEYLIRHEGLPESFTDATPGDGQLYDRTGPIDTAPDNLKVVDKTFYPESTLPGDFYTDEDGNVVYEDDESMGSNPRQNTEYTDEQISDLVNDGWIPVASAEELQHINDTSGLVKTWGAGTAFEMTHVGGLEQKYVQIRDIDLISYDNWTAIGLNPGVPFEGEYDGGNFTISNLTITMGAEAYSSGLFGSIDRSDVVISNIKLKEVFIENTFSYAGSLVGDSGSSGGGTLTISNVKVSDSYIAGDDAGGLVGRSGSTLSVDNVSYEGDMFGKAHVGGIVGQGDFGAEISIKNTELTTTISGGAYVGGILGYTKVPVFIEEASINGALDGVTVGGLIGGVYNGISGINIVGIELAANIIGTGAVGGLIGESGVSITVDDVTVEPKEDSYLMSGLNVGGIIGAHDIGNLIATNVMINYNLSGERVGGAIGKTNGKFVVENVKYTGNIDGVSMAGGLVGGSFSSMPNSSINNADVKGDISSSAGAAGGLLGEAPSGIDFINEITFEGAISGEESGGVIGALFSSLNVLSEVNINNADINGTTGVGGLIGVSLKGATLFQNVSISASIQGLSSVGELYGEIYAETPIVEGYTFNGTVTGTGENIGGPIGLDYTNH